MSIRQPETKITALYERLSREDGEDRESNSVQNQKRMLEDYAAKSGFANVVHFTDDGHSGGNFDRPGWKRMMEEIDAGNVAAVIVKDMSRVGRDYLQVGFYTEVTFREKGVRFIAIANNIDSQNQESGEFAPFLNIMSEWYLRDTSRKIKAAAKAKGMSGRHTTNQPIYGYMLDPADRDKWVIDPEAAEIVRLIFRLAIEGKGPFQIANILTDNLVKRPSCYLAERGRGTRSDIAMDNPYLWNTTSVRNILSKPEYKGHTVNFRTTKESYKDKSSKKRPQEDWVIFEDTHEAIVDAETWETAQRCGRTTRRTDTWGEANPLTGLLYCADCGARMYNKRGSFLKKLSGGRQELRCRDEYGCATFNSGVSKFYRKCTMHFIRSVVVRELVLDTIRSVSGYVREKEAEFVERVRETSLLKQDAAAKAHRKQIRKNQKRIAELDNLFRKMYEDYAAERLSPERFQQLSEGYEAEQASLKQQAALLQTEIDSFEADSVRADRFIELVKKYTDFTELTTPMLNEFVEKIVVHEADRSSGEREQKVDIYLNFIGQFEAPEEYQINRPETSEEEKDRLRRENQRERTRRYRERKKRRQQEQEQQQSA